MMFFEPGTKDHGLPYDPFKASKSFFDSVLSRVSQREENILAHTVRA